ncbi:MAG: PBP1A family penicillin-binding protein [Candidatus Paracaedibacteraceae bacterium]|nr:PBP1A family penicillin-binding protein [Candidatus Paracaedibacteraceae bacterium]
MPKKMAKKTKSSLKKIWLNRLFKLSILVLITLSIIIAWYSYDLPHIRTLEEAERKPSITMVTKDGELLTTYGDLYGTTITLEKVPSYVPKSVLAIEDHRFYRHLGIDIVAFTRAIYNNLIRGRVVQGGSSITQQLAKNFLLAKKKFHYTDRSLRRKVQELLVSLWLEYHFTKDQILSIYLNRIDFGAGIYGFDAAAQRYFFKPLHEVSIFEAAILAGMLKAPTRYNPLRHPEAAIQRGAVVINKMIEYNFISKTAGETEIKIGRDRLLNRKLDIGSYRYFTDWVMDTLPSYLGYIDRDLTVVTTLNTRAQNAAKRTIQTQVNQYGDTKGFKEMALISMNTDGEVIAMVGGKDYSRSQFNRTTQALRQPGSAFKPFVYIAAFEKGFTPSDTMNDEPKSYGKWKPKNIYNQYRGNLTLEEALAYSSNTITVKLLHETGVASLIKLARRLGIHTKLARNLTLALGSGEVTLFDLTAAYGVIANKGYEIYPHGVVEIRDKNTHELLYKSATPPKRKILDESVVKDIDHLLTSAVQYGTSRRSKLKNNIPSAGKSGTSQNYRDGWFIGYAKRTKGPITGIWLGNDDNSPTKGVTGGTLPAETWKMFHDMWLPALARETPIENNEPSSENENNIPQDGPPEAEGTLDGIDQVLNLIHPEETEETITPETIEEYEEFE